MNKEIGKNVFTSYWLYFCCSFIGLAIYIFFSATLNSPMLASDEYAFLISGKYLHNLNEIYKLDPYLQQVSNLLYFKIISVTNHFFGSQLVLGLRLLHIIEYFAAAFVLYNTLDIFVDKKGLLKGFIVFLFFPGALYVYTIMPEIELILLGSCFAYSLLKVFPVARILGCVFAGCIVSLAILIKPHAIALLITGLATVFVYPFFNNQSAHKSKLLFAATNVGILLVSAYITFIIVWRICASNWSFDPRDPLGLGFYGHYFVANPVSIIDKLVGIFRYATINLVVLYLIFAPALYWLIRSSIDIFNKKDEIELYEKLYVIFFITLILSHVLMISYFTFNAGLRNDGESMRIHGRYLGVVIALLTFLYFGALNKIAPHSYRSFPFSILLNALLFVFVIRFFKIFPWDYPLLFAFFDSHNSYWGFEGSIKFIKVFLLLFIVFGSILVLFKKELIKKVLVVQLFLIFSLGSLQTYSWLFSHLNANEKVSNTAKALKMMFMSDAPGKGIVGTQDRYGQSSYLLFNLANAPKVITKPASDSVFGANEVAGADWVLLPDLFAANFNYKNKVSLNGFNFYLIDSPISITQQKIRTLEKGTSVRLLLGRGQGSNVQLAGFNEIEDWGGWSSEENAEIQLPFDIDGHVKIKMFGWIMEENPNKLVQVSVGNVTTTMPFKDAGSTYDIDLQLNHPTNRINIHSSVMKPVSSHRTMGVAISFIIIENNL